MKKRIIAMSMVLLMLPGNAFAEISKIEYSGSGTLRIRGSFQNASGVSASVEVFKPGRVKGDADAYAYAAETTLGKDGNFDDDIRVNGESGIYTLRVGAEGQHFEKKFMFINEADRARYITAINNASNSETIADIFESDYGRLKALCEIQVVPDDKEYVYNAIFEHIPSGGIHNFDELKAITAEVVLINAFMNAKQDKFSALEKLFDYFDDKYISAIELWKNADISSDKIKNIIVKDLQGQNIVNLEQIQKAFAESCILNTLREVNSKGKELTVLTTVNTLINAVEYSYFSSLSQTQKIGILSNIGAYNTVEQYAKEFDKAVTAYRTKKPDSGKEDSSSSGSVVIPSADKPTKTPESNNSGSNQEDNGKFRDIDGYGWAKASIESLYDRGIISGKDSGIFAPQDNVTRAEFTSMIIKALGIEEADAICDQFTDIQSTDWFYHVIAVAFKREIIKGITETEFGPLMNITRQDAMVISKRAAESVGIVFDENEESGEDHYEYAVIKKDVFSDQEAISDYAQSSVIHMYDNGVIVGNESGAFNPQNNMTRAEAAVVIDRLIKMTNAKQTQVSSKDIKMLSQLKAFGIYDGSEQGMKSELTRGETAVLMCSMLNLQPYEPSEYIFSDCPADSEFAEAVYTVSEKGYMAASDNKFGVDEPLKYADAAKIAVLLLGYGQFVNEASDAYIKKASELSLLKDVQRGPSDNIAKRDFLKLFSNVLDTKVLGLEFTTGNITVTNTDKTFLNAYYDIYKEKGKVTANANAEICGEEKTGKGYIKIDKDEFVNHNSEYDNYIGREVTYYYRENNDEDEIVYMEQSTKTEIVTLNSSQIDDFSDMTYTYTSDDTKRDKKLKITKDVNIIYNTQRLYDYTDAQLNPKVGMICFIDSDGDGKYDGNDTVIITEYKNVVVNGTDATREFIYDKYTDASDPNAENYTINLKQYDEYSIKDKMGDAFGLRELREWDVIAVMESPDKEYAELTLVDECYGGKLNSIDFSANEIVIDNKTYHISKDFRGNMNSIKTGDKVTVYTDLLGEVAAVENGIASYAVTSDDVKDNNSLSEKIAILTDCRLIVNDNGEEVATLRSYYTDKKLTRTELAEKVKINGKQYKSVEKYADVNDILSQQLGKAVMLKLNGDNKIAEIVTAALPGEDENRGFWQLNHNTSLTFGEEANGFNRTFYKNNSTTIYTVPMDPEDYKDSDKYAVNTANFINNTNYNVIGYSTKKGSKLAEIMVNIAEATAGGTVDKFTSFVVGTVKQTLNEDNEVVKVVEGVDNYHNAYYGNITSYELSEDTVFIDLSNNVLTNLSIDDLEAGDCFRYGLNNGKIETIQLTYDYSENKILENTSDSKRAFLVDAYEIGAETSYITVVDGKRAWEVDESDPIDANYFYTYWIRNPEMYVVVDKTEAKAVIRKGSVEDIQTYKKAGRNCSRMVLFSENSSTVYAVVIYIE